MASIQTNLGYGLSGIVEVDSVTRILNGQFFDDEEARFDNPITFDGTFEYIGVAHSGSNIDDPVWSIVRVTWINNRKTRLQVRSDMAWSQRTIGWSD